MGREGLVVMLQTHRLFRTAMVLGALTVGVAATASPSRPVTEPDRLIAVGTTKNNANPNCNGKNNANCPGNGSEKRFGLTLGQIPLMYPGSSAGLSVRFTNPESFDIRVQTITLSAALAQPSEDCPLSKLVYTTGTTSYSPAIVVQAKGSVEAPTLTVGLSPTADETCEDAQFTIRAVATAVKR